MPYTDYNQVLQDLADNIREVNGSTASIRFVDMPDLIGGFVSPCISLEGETVGEKSSWKRKLIPYIDTSGMTDMHKMLKDIVAYQYPLDLTHFDTSNVTTMSHMFDGTKASDIDLSSFDTSNVTDMSYMFSECDGGNLDLSNFDTAAVTDMSFMFNLCYCSDLDLSSFDTSAVTDMQRMFYHIGCSEDIDLDLTHFDTSSVTNMAMMFDGFSAGQGSITLNVTGWDVSNVTTFIGCFNDANITELDLSGWDTSSASNMYNMFGSSSLRKIWVPSTFVATRCTSTYKPFTQGGCHVYTDASSATDQGWGNISSGYTMHYNSTHEDYENA